MKKAFTLIELLIVITLIAILALTLIPYVTKSVEESRMVRLSSDMKLIKNYISDYYKNQIKGVNETNVMSVIERSVFPLDYAHLTSINNIPASGTTMLSYLSKKNNIFLPTDPWGTPYSINIITGTLPDPVTIDFSKNPTDIKLLKFSSLSREKFASYDNLKYENLNIANPGDITIDLKYKLYYAENFTPLTADTTFTVKELYISAESGIMDYGADIAKKRYATINLANTGEYRNSFGTPARDYLKSRYEHLKTQNTNTLNDVERYNLYLSILFAETSTRKVILDIESLKIEMRLNSRVKNSSGALQAPVMKEFYFFPFSGYIDLTLYSAGPDRSFRSIKDNISRNERFRIAP
jgi:prepilin-type N-terminal cleavage/methylation domain-containing protein